MHSSWTLLSVEATKIALWPQPQYTGTSARGTGDKEHSTNFKGHRPLTALKPSKCLPCQDWHMPHGPSNVILAQPLELRPSEVVICPKPVRLSRGPCEEPNLCPWGPSALREKKELFGGSFFVGLQLRRQPESSGEAGHGGYSQVWSYSFRLL